MLYIVLAVSLVHLAWMNLLAYWKTEWPVRLASAGILLVFCGIGNAVLMIQAVALGALAVLCCVCVKKRPSLFAAGSAASVAAIFGWASWTAISQEENLKRTFPMESMAERVPAPKPGRPHRQVAKAAGWTRLEENLQGEIEFEESRRWSRSSMLRQIHEDATQNFVSSPGFGVSRMTPPIATPGRIDNEINQVKPVAQPGPDVAGAISTEDLDRPYAGPQSDALRRLHFAGLADFVNVKGFGYVKDRNHVAGFRSHRFSESPALDGGMRLQRLELVSLLLHEKPVVYVSNELPRMADFKKASTRSLSEFEAKGLGELQSGEDLFVRESPDGLLMLGAIRSVKQCIQCHGGERGDLLGAFSYGLTAGR